MRFMTSLMLTCCLVAGGAHAAQTQPALNGQRHADVQPRVQDPGADASRDLCEFAYDLECNSTFVGSSAFSFGNVWEDYWFFGETAPEIIHRLDHPGGLLSLVLSSTDSNQLDLILLGGCDQASVLDMPWLVGSAESISGNYPAGTYYVVVDAFYWDGQPFTYALDVTCAGDLNPCENAIPLPCGSTVAGSSAMSQNGNLWSSYCFGGDSGPEVIFELQHPGGALNLTLSSTDSDQLDLILLGGCDAANCWAMPWWVGSDEFISGDYPAGTYYVVVDAYAWNGLPYTFTLGAVCPGPADLCAEALPLATGETVTGSSALSQNGNVWGAYCFSSETAPEIIYELQHPGGELHLTLSSTDSQQLDLILLGSCDPAHCLAMPWWIGSDEFIDGDYPAGTYYVVVDAFLWNGQPFTYTLGTAGATVDAREQPAAFGLGSIHPNPFNPLTRVAFSLAESGTARLSVHDLAGREVAVLVNGMLDRGAHEVAFDGSALASGVYLCNLRVDGATDTRKMVLVK
jgi:hypothetical protein